MTDDIREKMIAVYEKTFDLPALLSARGFAVPRAAQDSGHVEMVERSTGRTLLLRKDVSTGTWSYQNAHHPEDHGRASHYLEAYDRLPRDQSLDRLIVLSTEASISPDALAYRRACREKPPELRDVENRHVIAMHQERATQRLLSHYGVEAKQLDGGRFGRFQTPSDLDRLVREPQRLGASAYRPTDQAIVLTERPLDAVGYERAKGNDRSFYLYTGSSPDEATLREVAQAIADVKPGTRVVLAFGRDDAGRGLAARIQALAPSLAMAREPPTFGARWADQMQIEHRHARSMWRSPTRGLVH
jgi:hypothetical protein